MRFPRPISPRRYDLSVRSTLQSAISIAASFAASLLLCAPSFAQTSIAVEVLCPARGDSFAPRLMVDGSALLLSWIEAIPPVAPSAKTTHRVCMSRCTDGAWSDVAVIASGENLFANWADTPTVVRATDGRLLATWLRKSAESTYAYDAVVSESKDDGKTWETLGSIHSDEKPAEHGFVSGSSLHELTAYCWLDGRAMELPDESAGGHGHGGGDMMLRATRVAPRADRVSPPSEILDDRVCECCPTDLAIGHFGPIIVYRDRGEDGTRDIAVVRWLGEGWSVPKLVSRDGWMLEGCPVNGPSISANGNDVFVAWWTGEPEHGAVRAARSKDGARSFSEAFDLDTDGSLGRVETLLLPNRDALVFWYDLDGANAKLVGKWLATSGSIGAAHTIARVSADRSSGFPRAVLQDNDVWLTCTAVDANKSRSVKLYRAPIAALTK